MTNLKDIGTKIKKLRESLKLTQEELAKKVGYTSKSSVNKVEKGEVDLSQSKIELFAKALGTTPSELMGWEKTKTTNLTEHELKIIQAYRNADQTTKININKILDININEI